MQGWGLSKKLLSGLGLAVVAVTLIGGYGMNWTWTGFPGNTLWDWMSLLLLPVTFALLPLAFDFSSERLWRFGAALAAVLAVLMVGGYGFGWSWTGFRGNTLWDWLHLLLVPVALPFFAHELSERQKQRRDLAEAHRKLAEAGREADAEPGGMDRSQLAGRHGGTNREDENSGPTAHAPPEHGPAGLTQRPGPGSAADGQR